MALWQPRIRIGYARLQRRGRFNTLWRRWARSGLHSFDALDGRQPDPLVPLTLNEESHESLCKDFGSGASRL